LIFHINVPKKSEIFKIFHIFLLSVAFSKHRDAENSRDLDKKLKNSEKKEKLGKTAKIEVYYARPVISTPIDVAARARLRESGRPSVARLEVEPRYYRNHPTKIRELRMLKIWIQNMNSNHGYPSRIPLRNSKTNKIVLHATIKGAELDILTHREVNRKGLIRCGQTNAGALITTRKY
jgi:hypothetical protein